MAADQSTAFLERKPGDKASVIGGGAARIADAERVALQTAHGRVLVRSIERAPDGAFAGEVYAVMPREPHAAIGERVRFSESQIFAFKVREAAAASDADDEIAQMARTFEESFRQFDAAAPKDSRPSPSAASSPSDASLFDMDISAVLQDLPAPPPTRVEAAPPRAQPAARAPRPKEKESDAALSTAEAMSILRAAENKGSMGRQKSVEPVLAEPAPAPKPIVARPPPVATPPAAPAPRVHVPIAEPPPRTEPVPAAPKPVTPPVISAPKPVTPPVVSTPTPAAQPAAAAPQRPPEAQADAKPAPAIPAGPEIKITCRECGSTLIVPPATETASEGQRMKVSCRACGRINEVKI